MTETNTIQQARDALAKWRKNLTSPLPWMIEKDGQDNITVDANRNDLVILSSREAASWASLDDDDARLIVGTAGNPDLLDAIDGLLEEAQRSGLGGWLGHFAVYFASAIIAADERMNA